VLGAGTGEHWTGHLVSGSFTAPGADERLALVGNIGADDEVRSVVIGQTEGDWRLLGVSEWRGAGFYSPPSFYLPPDLLDFDGDRRQEVLGHYYRVHQGRTISADTLYRWDGSALARVWSANTVLDNTTADNQDVPQPYRQNYRAQWEWVDLDNDSLDDILLREHVTFHPAEKSSWIDDSTVLGEETWERAFRWDGEAFRPSAPGGPHHTFAYIAGGDLWLWQDHIARPLGAEYVRQVHWSPDGLRLAWWAQPPTGGSSPGAVLGIYDLTTDAQRKLYLPAELLTLRWTPGGRLAYTLADRPLVLLDPETGKQELLPASPGTWSPGGGRTAYERDGSLYVYDLSVNQESPLVMASQGGEPVVSATISDPAWSPRGDWIAYLASVAKQNSTWVGLVADDLAEPLGGDDLLDAIDGWETSGLQFAWSPDGSCLAALTTDLHVGRQPAALYIAEVPSRGDTRGRHPTGRLGWRKIWQLDMATRTAKLAWSPHGDRMALAVGGDIWEVDVHRRARGAVSGDAVLRHRFSVPESESTVLEWAPDGSGFLAGLKWAYDAHLYWFSADGAEPVLLLAGSLGAAQWVPRMDDQPPMVLVEHTDNVPLIHFVGGDGSDTSVPARGADYGSLFQIGGGRVYHESSYTDRGGGVSLFASDVIADCGSPVVSPDGGRLAWLCDDSNGPPDIRTMLDGVAEVHFRLIVTDGQGRDPREVWTHVERGPDYRGVHLMHWRGDGEVIYLSRPRYWVAWAYFDYNPGILALDVDTGHVTQIGDLDGVHDGLVSSDGNWLVQSRAAKWPSTGVSVTLRSLVDGTERSMPCAQGSMVAGDFSFSPGNTWLAWREWGTGPGGASILIRALRLPDGEPLAVYRQIEFAAPQIGGWLRGGDLVLVYPMWEGGIGGYRQGENDTGDYREGSTEVDMGEQESGSGEVVGGSDVGGYSTLVILPTTGPGSLFSPFTFLGVLGSD
jgi:hypothetical protein